ncbi:MAG: hypothetical protein IPN71_21710 [Fibrobacteres bacterium]|nr:hypothetical protein [Fibrobacterota bacterium]
MDIKTIKNEYNGAIECNEVCVTIRPEASGIFLVNVRLINGKAIILDQIKSLAISSSGQSCIFAAKENISKIVVKIWRNRDDVQTLWYEKSFTLIRSLGMSYSMNQEDAIISSPKLERLRKETRLIRNVDEIAKIKLNGHSTSSIIGSNSSDKWASTIQLIEARWNLRHPKKSNSIFLPQGWDGQISFYLWLKDLPHKYETASHIFIIDPYLEEEAIRFIPRFERREIKYTLIANTKILENSLERVANICQCADQIFSLISGYDVEIYDVAKDKQLIHDRYILVMDSDGLFLGGYHLSNSIQMANKNYPLLITEIPSDIAAEIQNWLSGILDSSLDKIWDSKKCETQEPSATISIPEKIDYLPIGKDDIIQKLSTADVWDAWRIISKNAYNNSETSSNLESSASSLSEETWIEMFARRY